MICVLDDLWQKLTYVVCPDDLWSVLWTYYDTWLRLEMSPKAMNFGNQGLSSHSEGTKKVRFLEFLVS